ncbi:MAG: hypothetical protein K9M96_16065 [Deltaproteobacteria bacterium]|nr:hypothetical protein [Deltaproteobacteria bacterium]
MMRVLLYENGRSQGVKRIRERLESRFPHGFEPLDSIEGLVYRLRHDRNYHWIAVVAVSDLEDLSALLSIREWLLDLRIILILPEIDRELTMSGHRLYPRYIAYGDGDLEDVAAVLEKMLRLNELEDPSLGH